MNDSAEPRSNPNPIASEQQKTKEQQQISRHPVDRGSILKLIDRLKKPQKENPNGENG